MSLFLIKCIILENCNMSWIIYKIIFHKDYAEEHNKGMNKTELNGLPWAQIRVNFANLTNHDIRYGFKFSLVWFNLVSLDGTNWRTKGGQLILPLPKTEWIMELSK